jgi:ATP adenylyltransferase
MSRSKPPRAPRPTPGRAPEQARRIWAPWRIEYILAPKTDACFLCDMFRARADRKNLLLKRGRTCAVLINRYPYTTGHLMVAPYRHVEGLTGLRDAEMVEMMKLTRHALEVLSRVMRPQGFNVGLNLGEAAGAGLRDHVHLHVVPRWVGDTNFMPVLGDVRVMPQALDKLWPLLKAAF